MNPANNSYESMSQFSSRIPVVDLRDFYDPASRSRFVQKLGTAFQNHGFAAVINAKIDQSILNKAYSAVRDFFAQNIEYKRTIQSTINSGERGYVTGETPKNQPIEVTDFKEILHVGREFSNDLQQEQFDYPKNLWPENSDMKDSVMPLYEPMEEIMQPIACAAAEYLGESSELFSKMMGGGDHLLRFLHYLRSPNQSKPWAAAHTDMNFLTFIPRSSSEGLQVQLVDQSWEDVVVPEDALVINVGDSLENLTNGFYRSGVHRVISKPGNDSERWSVVFHGHTRHDLDMGPISSTILSNNGVQRFPDAKGWELLYSQIAAVGRASPSMLESLSKSGVMDRMIKYGKASEKVMRILDEQKLASELVLAELARINQKGFK